MSERDHLVRGSIFGFLIGLIAGILLAPKSGKETRDDIRRKTQDFTGDVAKNASKMQHQIGDKVEVLREVAKDLGVEARQQSQGLIARAEVMKQDLRASTKTLAQSGKQTKDTTLASIRLMMDEGAALMNELEQVTKELMRAAKSKLRRNPEPAGEAIQRLEELEKNGSSED
ncbi:MAG TPA: YtxH domain-containing protein [Candidatus Saccharimonadales bacterium]|nr:YtxH domain-containing protein [Candidatus Saccharimonadales bacterium]